MADRILVAFAGQPDGQIELVDNRQQPGQTNRILRQAGDYTPITESVGDIRFVPGTWDDSLKLSGCLNLTVNAVVVEGGAEDVLDVNRQCVNCTVNIADAYPRGNFVSTQKGQSDKITVNITRQHGHGKEVDHDYGNHSDQGNGYTKGCTLSAKEVTGEIITVRTLRYAGKPTLQGGPFKFVFPWPSPKWLHDLVIWVLNRVQ